MGISQNAFSASKLKRQYPYLTYSTLKTNTYDQRIVSLSHWCNIQFANDDICINSSSGSSSINSRTAPISHARDTVSEHFVWLFRFFHTFICPHTRNSVLLAIGKTIIKNVNPLSFNPHLAHTHKYCWNEACKRKFHHNSNSIYHFQIKRIANTIGINVSSNEYLIIYHILRMIWYLFGLDFLFIHNSLLLWWKRKNWWIDTHQRNRVAMKGKENTHVNKHIKTKQNKTK